MISALDNHLQWITINVNNNMNDSGHIWFLLLIISGILPCFRARASDTAITNDDSKLNSSINFKFINGANCSQ